LPVHQLISRYYTLVQFPGFPDNPTILIYNRVVKKISLAFPSLRICHLIWAILLLLAMVSCTASPPERPWSYADLRALNAQVASSPATDILAVYTRFTDLSVDVRVDLLDINAGDHYTLKIILRDNQDHSQTPLVIEISSPGMVRTSGIGAGKPAIWPRVVQNHWLDTITVNLNRSLIGSRYRLDVSSYSDDPVVVADEVHDIHSDGQPPVRRAPILLAFWDAFSVTTPAQALRHWDGAHTGPLGSRHGLRHILDAASRYNVPVALIDIKNPASLAALDFMGNITKLKELSARGLLILPDVAYAEPASVALDFSHQSAAGFGLPASSFFYAPASDPALPAAAWPAYRAVFLPLNDRSHLGNSGGRRLIPLPATDAVEATANGPALGVRRAMITAATSPDPAALVLLGGSLPHSTWGDSDMAQPTFEWIAAHPWIQPLTGSDLLTFPAKTQPILSATSLSAHPWLEKLRSTPQNALSRSAWQTYLMLTSVTPDPRLQSLRTAYLGQVGEILAAADWAGNPATRMDCLEDLNGDGQAECILANQNYFAVLEPVGARLTQLFNFDAKGPHQLVGPSWQFAVGLSDPSTWRPELGQAADPSAIPGAFADSGTPWETYTPTITPAGITFTNPDGSRIKIYRLTKNGMQVRYQAHSPVSTHIPLVVDPEAFYSGPTKYQATLAPHSWTWSLAGGSNVEVHTDGVLSAEGFTSAIPFLSMPEDPNLGYPAGNYLPFPLSVVTIQGNGAFSVEIISK
jgi:hypothetical protein